MRTLTDARGGVRARGRDRLLRRQAGGLRRLDGDVQERDHRADRSLGLRQVDADPLPQPDERPDPLGARSTARSSTTARTSTASRSTRSRSASGSGWCSRSRTRSRSRSTTTSPSARGSSDMDGDMDEIVERALRRAALWDEVKDRLETNAFGMSGGQQQRLCIARCLAVEPRRDPDGRALLGARPDLDREDRGPDAGAEERLLDRDRHPQHAAGRAGLGHDRLPDRQARRRREASPGAAGRVRRDREDLHQPRATRERRIT